MDERQQNASWLEYHPDVGLVYFQKYFHWIHSQENILNDLKITKIGQRFAEGEPSLRLHGVGSHLGRHLGFWKIPPFELNLLPRSCLSYNYSSNYTRLFQSISVIFWQVWQDFHWQATPKWFVIKIHHDTCLLCLQKCFHWIQDRGKHKKTQRSPKSLKRLQNEVHHCKSSLALAAILDFANAQGWTQFTRQIMFMWFLSCRIKWEKNISAKWGFVLKISFGYLTNMRPVNERWCYTVTPCYTGWAYKQNDPCHCLS